MPAAPRKAGTTPKEPVRAHREPPQRISLMKPPPQRIETGVPDVVIGFHTDYFYGYPDQFDFGEYSGKHERLSDILERNDIHFHQIGVGRNGAFTAVVGYLNQPLFIWENYMGDQGKHEEFIYVAGVKMHLETFLKKIPKDQDELLANARLKAWVIQ